MKRGRPIGSRNTTAYERECVSCGSSFVAHHPTARFCSDNHRKRHNDATTGRGKCADCGERLGPGSKGKITRCRECHLVWEVENSTVAYVLRRFNEGATLIEIGREIDQHHINYVGSIISRVRHEPWGKRYIERWGFPEYRRSEKVRQNINAGRLAGLAQKRAA